MRTRSVPGSGAGGSGRHRSKVLAAWLALLLGAVGAHWWYLGRRHAWCVTLFGIACLAGSQAYDSWWDNPPFLALILPMLDGFVEALVFALKPDDWFDRRYNAGSGKQTRTGWNAVIVAIMATFFGGTVLVFWIAMIVMHVYEAMGWLDGFVY